MGSTITILEAEQVYREALEEGYQRFQRKARWGKVVFLAGIALTIISAAVLFTGSYSASSMAFIGFAVGVMTAVMTPIYLLIPGSLGVAEKEDLRDAQERWVESHGFTIPQGCFDSLKFGLIPDRSKSTVYGVTQLFDGKTNSLISVALKMEPKKGYVLYGTDGKLLKPLRSLAKA